MSEKDQQPRDHAESGGVQSIAGRSQDKGLEERLTVLRDNLTSAINLLGSIGDQISGLKGELSIGDSD